MVWKKKHIKTITSKQAYSARFSLSGVDESTSSKSTIYKVPQALVLYHFTSKYLLGFRRLALGYILGDRDAPFTTGSPFDNPWYIWIYNDNAQDELALAGYEGIELVANHYEGLKPKPYDVSDLPDYEDYESD